MTLCVQKLLSEYTDMLASDDFLANVTTDVTAEQRMHVAEGTSPGLLLAHLARLQCMYLACLQVSTGLSYVLQGETCS